MLYIRQYNPSDKNAILKLNEVSLKNTNAYLLIDNFYKDLEDIEGTFLNNNGEFLVGLLDDRLVAMGGLYKISVGKVELKRMRIHPDYQRKGFGQLMLNRLEDRAVELGYNTIELSSTINQLAAIKFYLKNGYREIQREKERLGIESIVYEKTL